MVASNEIGFLFGGIELYFLICSDSLYKRYVDASQQIEVNKNEKTVIRFDTGPSTSSHYNSIEDSKNTGF